MWLGCSEKELFRDKKKCTGIFRLFYTECIVIDLQLVDSSLRIAVLAGVVALRGPSWL